LNKILDESKTFKRVHSLKMKGVYDSLENENAEASCCIGALWFLEEIGSGSASKIFCF